MAKSNSISILVVGSRHDQKGEELNLRNYRNFFQETLASNYKINSALIDDLIFDISPKRLSIFDSANSLELSNYKAIIIRGKLRDDLDSAFSISIYAKRNNLFYFNDYSGVKSTSKLCQAMKFYLLKLSFPRILYCSPNNLLGLIKEGKITPPFIYKDRLGAHGDKNYLIEDVTELEKVGKWGFVAQEFIPNDGDFRVLIIGKQHMVIKRTAVDGTHLNNTSKGSKAKLVTDFNKQTIKGCFHLAESEKLSFAGIDVILDKNNGQYYFLEINSQPQLATGAFVDGKQDLIRDFFAELGLDQG